MKLISPHFINPFAIGQQINHPPPNTVQNVIVLDLIIPNHFFPLDYLRFLPYLKFSTDQNQGLKEHYHDNCIRGAGVFALREIQDGEELFMDYFHCKLYEMEKSQPDWLIRPPPFNPYLTKYEYQIKFSFFTNLIDNYFANKNLQQYIKFENHVSHDPTVFQKDTIKNLLNESEHKIQDFKKF